MEMYHFITKWLFKAPIERVWDEAANVEAYPEWWENLKKAKIRGPAASLQLGSVVDCEVKGALPFSLRFAVEVTKYQPPDILEIKSSGDLVGCGKWMLEPQDGGTLSTFYWDVGTSNTILNLLGRLRFMKAILMKNHDDVMSRGYEIVRARLEAPGNAAYQGK